MKRSATVLRLLKVAKDLAPDDPEIEEVITKCLRMVEEAASNLDCIEHGLVSDKQEPNSVEEKEAEKAKSSLKQILKLLDEIHVLMDDVPRA